MRAATPTYVSTARDDKRSGIRFYRVPPGRKWKESAAKDIEVIQRVHRYAIAWPSIHPDGWQYRWYWSDNFGPVGEKIPQTAHLPMLPDAWIEELTEQAEYVKPSERLSFTEHDTEGILTGGTPCQAVVKALDKYGVRKVDDSARFIAMRDTQLQLVRLGEQARLTSSFPNSCVSRTDVLDAALVNALPGDAQRAGVHPRCPSATPARSR